MAGCNHGGYAATMIEEGMRKHTLTLIGGPSGALRIPAETLVETIGALIEGAQRAARLFVEGESVRKGPRPAWLDAVCKLEIMGLHAGSTVVPIEAPTLAEAAPDRFGASAQIPLFGEPSRSLDVTQSAVDLFGGVLAAAITGEHDALLADRALLDTCARFVRAAGTAYQGVQLEGIAARAEPIVVRSTDLPQIELLRDNTPPPRAVRVTGVLDTISASSTAILLALPEGQTVQARLEHPNPELLRALFGTRVVISGMAQFRPSGRLLIVDIEHLGPAGPSDVIWEQVPTARTVPVATLQPQDESSGVNAFFGIWPGDESDEELLQALESLG
jgi:hypothetical protein